MLSLGRRLSQRRLRSLFPFFSSSSSSASSSGRFDGQKVLLNRQTARPVLFDELESDDDLDFSLSEKPTGEELYERSMYDLARSEEDDFSDEEGEDPRPDMKVGKQLLAMGKVQYRRIEYLPDWVMERKQQISDYRTPRQVRRCIKNWMLKPDRNLQQEYAFRPLGWDVSAKQSATPSPTATAGARGKAPKTKAGKTQPDNSTPFVYGPEETVAYCNFFFPSRFAITQRIFRELKMLMPKYQPRRILDLGCGVGTVGACAVDVWGSSGPGVQKYVGIDQSAAMLDAAKIMTKQMGVLQNREDEYGAAASAKVKQYTPSSSTRGKRSSPEVTLRHQVRPIDVVLHTKTAECVKRIQRGGDKERFDMAAVAYTLSELQTDATKRAAVQVLYEALDVNGVLVLIDNGSPIGSHGVRTARQFLLDMFNSPTTDNEGGAENPRLVGKTTEVQYVLPPPTNPETDKPYRYEDFTVKVLAPCTHDRTCPLKPGAWCSFKQKTQSSMIRKASEEKFSYVILQKQLKKSPADENHRHAVHNDWTLDPDDVDPERDPTPLATMQRFLEAEGEEAVEDLVEDLVDEVDWDDYNPPLFRAEYGRLIRSPLKKKGHVILDTCQADGNLTRSVLSKSEVWQVPTLYSALRKLRWGGLVPVLPLQQQAQSGPYAETHHNLISDELEDSNGKETGFMPSSFVGQSPMSKKSASMEPPVKLVVPPPVKVGRRSPIWNEGDGLKKNDRNRNYQGLGGLIMDEDRGYNDSVDFHENAEMEQLSGDMIEEVVMHKDRELLEELQESAWDVDDDEEEEDDDVADALVNDEEENEDELSQEQLDKMSKDINSAIGRLRKGDLPRPEDEGLERFFPDNAHNEAALDDDEGDEHDFLLGAPTNDEMTESEQNDLDILKQLRQHHSLDSLGDSEDAKSIEWEKVFADLQKDGAFDDIDMSALEELESSMKGTNWDDFKGDGDDGDSNEWQGENGLDMDAFAKMLGGDSSLGGEAGLNSFANSMGGVEKPSERRMRREAFEDDDEEEEWQRGIQATRSGADVVINAAEGGKGKNKDLQGLKKFDKLAKSRLDTLREATEGFSEGSEDPNSPVRRGRRRRGVASSATRTRGSRSPRSREFSTVTSSLTGSRLV